MADARGCETPWWYTDASSVPTTVLRWIDKVLDAQGKARIAPVQVTHARPWSLVARVETDAGLAHLKVASPATRHEIPLVEVLARAVPDGVVVPWASDPERGLMLVPDGGPLLGDGEARRSTGALGMVESHSSAGLAVLLSHTTPATVTVSDPQAPRWDLGMRRGLAGMAQLQRQSTPLVPELLRIGVPDMRPHVLVDRFDEALDEAAARALTADSAWIRDQVAAIVQVRPQIVAEAAELGALAVQPSINHDDLHPWNLLRPTKPGRTPRAIDWGDAVISHPFSVLLVPLRARRVREDHEPGVAELRKAYLGAWADAAPTFELRRSADLACRLGSIIRAHAWLRVLRAADEQRKAGVAGGPVTVTGARRGIASADLVPLLWLRNLALPSFLGVPTLQG